MFVIESGEMEWAQFKLTRDYLLANDAARGEYAAERAAWSGDEARKEKFFARMWTDAQTGWIETRGFEPVQELARELAGLTVPWYISSGWALDLFIGRVTRVHHDMDVQIAYVDQLAVREHLAARGWKWVTPYNKRFDVWSPHMRIEPPRHQAHAHRDGEFLDFLLSDVQNGVWTYRREPSIVQTMQRMTLASAEGIPYLAPEIVLLFKSRNTSGKERSKDFADFETVLPYLGAEQKAWLRWTLLVTDAAHPWLERL